MWEEGVINPDRHLATNVMRTAKLLLNGEEIRKWAEANRPSFFLRFQDS